MAAAVAYLFAYVVGSSIHATRAVQIRQPVGDSAEDQPSNLACAVPDTFCKLDGATLSYQDCDGDGTPDPFCQGPDLLKFGYISSKKKCKVNWPNGYCSRPRLPPGNKGMARENQITIIHFNDVYQLSGVMDGGVRRGGMSRAAYVINNERRKNPDRTFAFFAGDLLSPSTLSGLFEGAQMIDILNEMELDAASLGNHEFDFGVDVLKTRVQESKFPWLNVNLNDETGGLFHGTKKHLIKDIPFTPTWGTRASSTRFCAFGAAYDVRETIFKDTDRVGYLPIMNASLSEATYLREEQGCDVVVALTHQFSQDDCRLSAFLGDKVDLILGGHDHSTEYKTACGHAPYAKADSDLKTQWVVKLFLGPEGKVQTTDATLMTLTDADPFHVQIHDKVLSWESKAADKMGEKIGCQAEDLIAYSEAVRGGETAIGNWFVDTTRASQKTDVSIYNGGGIRGNRVYSAGDLNTAIVTAMHPFGNNIAKVLATGAELRSFISESLDCYETACGSFIHVSGLNYTFKPDMPRGKRLIKLLRPSGEIVGNEDVFSVALSDYMFLTTSFADNEFYGMTTLNDAVPLVDLLIVDVKAAGANCINPKLDGRIQKH